MDKQDGFLRILKSIGGACFLIAFILAVNIFGNIGRSYLSLQMARYLFIGFGGLGLVLNLVTFQTGKYHPVYNLTYWGGAIVTFIGLIFNFMRWQYSRYILIAGLLIVGISFFLPKKWVEPKESNPELLDD